MPAVERFELDEEGEWALDYDWDKMRVKAFDVVPRNWLLRQKQEKPKKLGGYHFVGHADRIGDDYVVVLMHPEDISRVIGKPPAKGLNNYMCIRNNAHLGSGMTPRRASKALTGLLRHRGSYDGYCKGCDRSG